MQFSRCFTTTDPDTLQRHEWQIVQSRLNLDDSTERFRRTGQGRQPRFGPSRLYVFHHLEHRRHTRHDILFGTQNLRQMGER